MAIGLSVILHGLAIAVITAQAIFTTAPPPPTTPIIVDLVVPAVPAATEPAPVPAQDEATAPTPPGNPDAAPDATQTPAAVSDTIAEQSEPATAPVSEPVEDRIVRLSSDSGFDLTALSVKAADGYGPAKLSLRDWVRGQIEHCWRFDPRVAGGRQLRIDLLLELDQAGGLAAEARTLGLAPNRISSDPALKLFVASARRAVRDCAPFSGLPPERYGEWRSVRITFVSS